MKRLPADDPALAWAIRLPEPVVHAPAPDPGRDRVYVGAGENSIRTPTGGEGGPSGAVFGIGASDGGLDWRADADAPVVERPVVHGGRVHAVIGYSSGLTGADQRILALGRDGERRWATDPRDEFVSIVAAGGGAVFAGTGNDALGVGGETLFALEADGAVRWERGAGDAMGGTMAEDSLLYVAGGQALVSYDPADGTKRWETRGEPLGNPTTGIATHAGLCFTESPEEDEEGYPLVARSVADGAEQWRYSAAPGSGENFVPTGVAGVADGTDGRRPIVGTEYGGTVFALDPSDGSERWTFAADADTRDGPVVGGSVYVGDADGTVYALDSTDGSERWRASLSRFAGVRPLPDGVLAFSRGEGERVVASFRDDGSERWRYATSKDLTRPAVAGDRVYVGAADGTVLGFAT